MRFLAVMLVLLAAVFQGSAQVAEAADRCQEVEKQLASPGSCRQTGKDLARLLQGYAGFGFSGVVLVARGDTILLHEAYGLADSETGRENFVTTRFPLLSITKTMVATGLLHLADEEKLDLESPLSAYLGEFPEDKAAATTHELLTHTAGLIQEGYSTRSAVREEFVVNVKNAPVETPPGESWRYSNAGYSLAAALIEVVSGTTWEAYLSETEFKPAGMKSAAVLRGVFPADVASGHRGDAINRRVMNFSDAPPYVSELWWGAAGATGVVCTVADLYRWLNALAENRLISEENRKRMLTAHIRDQGYGLHVDEIEGRRRIWKGGGAPNYETQMAWYPDDDTIVVIAMNDHVGWRVPVWSAIEDLLFKNEFKALPDVLDSIDIEVKPLIGSFRTPTGEEVRFFFESGLFVYEPVEIAEESGLPQKPLVMKQLKEGGFAGVEVVAVRPETPVTRLLIDNGSPSLVLPDGTVVKLIPAGGSTEEG
jgi:CubicO group peptidase (beta-lactamase class C family)